MNEFIGMLATQLDGVLPANLYHFTLTCNNLTPGEVTLTGTRLLARGVPGPTLTTQVPVPVCDCFGDVERSAADAAYAFRERLNKARRSKCLSST